MKTGPFVGEKGPTPQPRARPWIFCLPAPRLGACSLNTWVDPNGKRPDILSALVANVRPTRSHPVPAPLADDAHHSQPPFLLSPDAARIQGPRPQRLRPSDQGPRTQGCQRTPVCVRAKQSEMLEASARWPKFCFLSFLFSRFYQGVRLSLVRMLLPRWKVRALERVSQCRPKCRFHRVIHSTGSFLKGGNGRIFLNFRRGFRSLRKGLGTSPGLGAGGFGKGEKERRRASPAWLTSFGLGPAPGSKADR